MTYASVPQDRPVGNRGIYDRFQLINRRNIHNSRYTQSLVSEALRVGMIPMELVDDIQMQVRGVLEEHLRDARRERVRQARSGTDADDGAETSTQEVDEAAARGMLDSIFYSLDAYLLGFHDPMYAINALQGMAVDDMFRSGQKVLKALICESVALSVQVRKSRIQTDNRAYNQTLDEDVRMFLSGYDYRRAGHKTVLPMAYPLADSAISMTGIHRLRDYLSRCLTENRFAALFDREELDLLFRAYAEQHGTDTAGMQVNLFTLIFRNALGASILGKYPGILSLTEEEISVLNNHLHRKTTRELEMMSAESICSLIADLHPEPSVEAYLKGHAKQFARGLVAARDARSTAKLFVASDPKALFML